MKIGHLSTDMGNQGSHDWVPDPCALCIVHCACSFDKLRIARSFVRSHTNREGRLPFLASPRVDKVGQADYAVVRPTVLAIASDSYFVISFTDHSHEAFLHCSSFSREA